jgi:kinesin family member 6/9
VALVKNEALVNEELDPRLIIGKLKREVDELKNQLAITNIDYDGRELNADELTK